MSRQDLVKRWLRAGAGVALLAVAVGLCRGLDVDVTTAAMVLLVTILVATVLDRIGGALTAVLAFLALNYFFTPPVHSLDVAKEDDLVALAAFAAASALTGWTVARLDGLRRTAEQRQQETLIRLDLTSRILAGEDPDTIVTGAAGALLELFDLHSCTVRTGNVVATAAGVGPPADPIHLRVGPLAVDVVPRGHALSQNDRALLEALISGLSTALDRLRLEAEARDARIAAQVGRTRSVFLSAVTHNLRTPLASIKAASSALRAPDARLDDADRAEMLDTIHDETDRLERLVTNILELSRIRAGALEVHRQTVGVADLVQAAVRRLRPLARAHRVRIDVTPTVGDISADIEMMEQVFGNLLENALHYAPPGSEILVQARRAIDTVEIRVADHGPGVPDAERARIFEEFARVDARPDASGTGLGLAIVHSLVAAHGGAIHCEETPGGGATFVMTIPALRTAAAARFR